MSLMHDAHDEVNPKVPCWLFCMRKYGEMPTASLLLPLHTLRCVIPSHLPWKPTVLKSWWIYIPQSKNVNSNKLKSLKSFKWLGNNIHALSTSISSQCLCFCFVFSKCELNKNWSDQIQSLQHCYNSLTHHL